MIIQFRKWPFAKVKQRFNISGPHVRGHFSAPNFAVILAKHAVVPSFLIPKLQSPPPRNFCLYTFSAARELIFALNFYFATH